MSLVALFRRNGASRTRLSILHKEWRFASTRSGMSTKEIVGKPPVLPKVEKHEIPRLFKLDPIEQGTYRASFHGNESPMGMNVYGGLLFAQGLQAAQMDVPEGFVPTALHSLFVSYPFSKYPIDYKVQHLRDGGTLCARSVTGIQNGKVVFSGIANFSKPSETTVFHTVPLPDVPKPEQLADHFEFCEQKLADNAAGKVKLSKFVEDNFKRRLFDKPYSVIDVRPVEPELLFIMKPFKNVPLRCWIKSSTKIDDPNMHRLIVCYLSDMYLVGSGIFPHVSQGNEVSLVASLDNTIWFHNYDFDSSDWLLYEVQSPIADSGRTISHGKIWTKDGKLIASTAQEVLARFKNKSSI